ncbi:hypothetical protein ACQ4PT_050764 [Festuca glaucescens]
MEAHLCFSRHSRSLSACAVQRSVPLDRLSVSNSGRNLSACRRRRRAICLPLCSACEAASSPATSLLPLPHRHLRPHASPGTQGFHQALSHAKSPTNPDAVTGFLAGLGFSSADVAKDPKLLCAGVERTLTPILVGLTGLGLSHSEIARLVSLTPGSLRGRSILSNLPYFMSLFGSYENLLWVLKHSPDNLLASNLERVVTYQIDLATNEDALGDRKENIAARVDHLKKTLRWSDAEVGIAASKHPFVLLKSKEMMQHRSAFLFSEVGLEPAYIAHRPALLSYSLEGWLKPNYYAVKFLRENGLVKCDPSYFTVVNVTEKVFVEKFICPHKKAAPQLSEDYAAACRGEVPTMFRFI